MHPRLKRHHRFLPSFRLRISKFHRAISELYRKIAGAKVRLYKTFQIHLVNFTERF